MFRNFPVGRTAGAIVLVAAMALSGCKKDAAPAPGASEQASEQPGTAPSEAPSEAVPVSGRHDKVENDLYAFEYAYPAAAAAIPRLKELLDSKLADAETQLAAGARQNRREAETNKFPFHQHTSETQWKVVTHIPGWLSLSSETYFYTGGAHGMTETEGLLWDESNDVAHQVPDLFITSAALRGAITGPFCDALDRQREKKRGEPIDRNSGEMFSECIDPLDSTLILGSSNGKTFDRIGILVAPYAAGPYVEGSYEVTLPVTSAVMATIKPAYRDIFSLGS